MRRITLTVVAVLLAVPAAGWAKTGVELQTVPQDLQPGQKTKVSMLVLKDPGEGQPPRAEAQPVDGVRPLATFRNAQTGEVVRVRGTRTRDGHSTATVSFPSRGDWSVELTAPGVEPMPGGQQVRIGIPNEVTVMETVSPPADTASPAGSGDTGFPWVIVVLGLAGVGLLAVTARFGPRRLRAALPAWLGGGG
jgi:hypothetical protein